jgi:hypothetical protein
MNVMLGTTGAVSAEGKVRDCARWGRRYFVVLVVGYVCMANGLAVASGWGGLRTPDPLADGVVTCVLGCLPAVMEAWRLSVGFMDECGIRRILVGIVGSISILTAATAFLLTMASPSNGGAHRASPGHRDPRTVCVLVFVDPPADRTPEVPGRGG